MTSPFHVTVEVEESVYDFVAARNGAGPLWCMGGTTLVRLGREVFATGLDTVPDAKPLNNCRWHVMRRSDQGGGWERVYTDTAERTREPAPLACFEEGRLFVSANPARTNPDDYAGPAEPQVLEFEPRRPSAPRAIHHPVWSEPAPFCEHSYRSFAADGGNGELWLAHNIGYDRAYWSFRDRLGKWSSCGKLVWPWGADYAEPQPIRVCYPCVALRQRAVHVFGVSDIQDPNPAFRAFKLQLTGNEWDYDFRRLFYAWTPDVTASPFQPWIEIASREATCGWMSPCDLRVEDDGLVHLLWHERSCDVRLREKFFPGVPLTNALEYALLQEGRILRRSRLVCHHEHDKGEMPVYGRFHDAGDGRLYVIAVFQGLPGSGQAVSNRVLQLRPDGLPGEWRPLRFQRPFTHPFFTATPRAGTRPSEVIDLLGCGTGRPETIQYARVRLDQQTPAVSGEAARSGS